MNLRDQKRKLILFLTLCLCILGLFVFIISNSSSSSATHEHAFGKWYYKPSSLPPSHYRQCKCGEIESVNCSGDYLIVSDIIKKLKDLGFSTDIIDESDTSVCYSLCKECNNIDSNGSLTTTPIKHDYHSIPEHELTEEQRITYLGNCVTLPKLVEECSNCHCIRYSDIDGATVNENIHIMIKDANKSISPTCVSPGFEYMYCSYHPEVTEKITIPADKSMHDFCYYDRNASVHWKKCRYCGTPDEGTTEEHHGDTKVVRLGNYYDIAYCEVNKFTCSDCGFSKYESIDKNMECPNSSTGYHLWKPETHEDNGKSGMLYYYCAYCDYGCRRSYTRRL